MVTQEIQITKTQENRNNHQKESNDNVLYRYARYDSKPEATWRRLP